MTSERDRQLAQEEKAAAEEAARKKEFEAAWEADRAQSMAAAAAKQRQARQEAKQVASDLQGQITELAQREREAEMLRQEHAEVEVSSRRAVVALGRCSAA